MLEDSIILAELRANRAEAREENLRLVAKLDDAIAEARESGERRDRAHALLVARVEPLERRRNYERKILWAGTTAFIASVVEFVATHLLGKAHP